MSDDHDIYESDASGRIQPSQWRKPRAVVIDVNEDGHEFWGELAKGDFSEVMETTLTGRVLNPIQAEVRAGKNGGSVMIDGIEYVFVVTRKAAIESVSAPG